MLLETPCSGRSLSHANSGLIPTLPAQREHQETSPACGRTRVAQHFQMDALLVRTLGTIAWLEEVHDIQLL